MGEAGEPTPAVAHSETEFGFADSRNIIQAIIELSLRRDHGGKHFFPNTRSKVDFILTIIFGIITVVGTGVGLYPLFDKVDVSVNLSFSSSTTNWLLISSLISLLAAIRAYVGYRVEMRRHRIVVLNEDTTLTLIANGRKQSEERVRPEALLVNKRTIKSLQRNLESVTLSRYYKEHAPLSSEELIRRTGFHCAVYYPDQHSTDPRHPGISASVDTLVPFNVTIALPRSLDKNEVCTFVDTQSLGDDFNEDDEHFDWGLLSRTKTRTVRVVFVNIKPSRACYLIRQGRYRRRGGNLPLCELKAPLSTPAYYVEFEWRKPRLGEMLRIEWSWNLRNAAFTPPNEH